MTVQGEGVCVVPDGAVQKIKPVIERLLDR